MLHRSLQATSATARGPSCASPRRAVSAVQSLALAPASPFGRPHSLPTPPTHALHRKCPAASPESSSLSRGQKQPPCRAPSHQGPRATRNSPHSASSFNTLLGRSTLGDHGRPTHGRRLCTARSPPAKRQRTSTPRAAPYRGVSLRGSPLIAVSPVSGPGPRALRRPSTAKHHATTSNAARRASPGSDEQRPPWPHTYPARSWPGRPEQDSPGSALPPASQTRLADRVFTMRAALGQHSAASTCFI